MSNFGQAALIVVGTVVGAYFGNPQLGFVLGGLAGSALFPTQLPDGPQITDNRTTGATIGAPIPIVFGTASVAGNVMWLSPVVTSTNEQGSKGGPEQKLYQYNQSIAILLCEAVVDGGTAIGGMTRVWENGTLMYDVRPQQVADTANGLIAETDEEYENRLTASAVYAETFTLYLGDELQTADPTIEAVEGIGNVPGFRGTAYIVYPNRLLQVAQGLRHPNFQFEVYEAGTGECTDTSEYSNEVLFPWGDNATTDPVTPGNVYSYQYLALNGGSPGPPETTRGAAISDGSLQSFLYGWNTTSGNDSINPWFPGSPTGNEETVYLFYNSLVATSKTFTAVDSSALCDFIDSHQGGWWTGWLNSGGTLELAYSHGVVDYVPGGGNIGLCPGGDANVFPDDAIGVTRSPGPPADPCQGLPASPIPGYCVRGDGKYVKGGAWTIDSSQTYKVLAPYATSGGSVTQAPLNPCIPDGSTNDNETFWTAAYDAAVTAGQIPSGLTYPSGYPSPQASAYTIDSSVCSGIGAATSVAAIIAACCARAGVNNIDVSQMETVPVAGLAVSSLSSAADIITPLRSIGFFDAVETGAPAVGPSIRFQARGGDIVATLTTDDIGAYDAGNAGETVPPSISVVRALDSDLPSRVRLHYVSVARDYQPDEQDSPFRPTRFSTAPLDISIPMAIGDTQALQAAEIIWADAWNGRSQYTTSVDQAWSALEDGDPIAIPLEGFTVRVRIVNTKNSGGVLRQFVCVSDSERAYISVAIAPPPAYTPPTLRLLSQTIMELMDLPALQEADSDPGFYVAAARDWSTGNQWKGAQIYKSVDGGATDTSLFALVVEAAVGTLAMAVPSSEYVVWDDTTVIALDVASVNITFESRTDDAVLAGANAAAMGDDGRWEIIQFANAEKVSDTVWHLSRLLRGRRGTEHVIGTSVAGDRFVMVSTGDLNRVVLQSTEIGATRLYRGVSIGASFSSGVTESFVGRGVALKPFSPVDPVATVQSDGDILLSWTRRDRLGGTLMSGVDMPLSEATLAFQVDIIDATPSSPEVIIRTLTTSSTSVLYTAAEQTTDFGGAALSLRIAIYQMSAIVGRGTPCLATLAIPSH